MSLYAALDDSRYINEHWQEDVNTLYEKVAFRNVIGADRRLQTSGVAFARKSHLTAMAAKNQARQRILDSMSRIEWPGKLSVLTMPGLEWIFENHLIDSRDYESVKNSKRIKFRGAEANGLDFYLAQLVRRLREAGIPFVGPFPAPVKLKARHPFRRFISFTNLPQDFIFDLPERFSMKVSHDTVERSGFCGVENQTEIYAVERDPAVYFGSIKWMPASRSGLTQFSAHAIGTSKVKMYYFTDVETFGADSACPEVDAAWLDFTGYMTPNQLYKIRRFWRERCRWQLAITVLNARYPAHVKAQILKHKTMAKWIINTLGGDVYNVHHYFDEHSAMLQIIIRK